nr:MAG TPA: hypothetical protein [Caudoviricetes sp.]DAO76869.1 MAG TPA: hypothetical protein [Caudoviricetes sp.]DAS07361.1 MAG TPA: hypothetical protein [Caudoviricetes sp.]
MPNLFLNYLNRKNQDKYYSMLFGLNGILLS